MPAESIYTMALKSTQSPRTAESQSRLQLVDTRGLVDRKQALDHSAVIYEHFANWPNLSECYIELSRVVRQNLDQIDDPRGIKFDKDLARSLESHELLAARGLGQRATHLSLRGLVSVNMVVPDSVEEGVKVAHLQEPFTEVAVLGKYFQAFAAGLEATRRTEESSYHRTT